MTIALVIDHFCLILFGRHALFYGGFGEMYYVKTVTRESSKYEGRKEDEE